MKIKGIRMSSPEDLKGLMEHLQECVEDDCPKTPLGTLPQHLVNMYKDFHRKEGKLHREMDGRVEELAVKMKNIISQEFSDRIEEMSEMHDKVWGRIYTELGLDPKGNYEFNPETNEILGEGPPVSRNNSFTH